MTFYELHELAVLMAPSATMRSSCDLLLEEGGNAINEGNWKQAAVLIARSLRYSIGISSPIYKEALDFANTFNANK
jgi:hypothetical protein